MRRLALQIALMAGLPVAGPASGQAIVQSDRIDSVSVTLYREPGRGEGAIRPGWPGGYALITETRTIAVPAGRSVIRFEGVSEGMLPESAIVSGLPRRVNEKNRDARLLSPASLVDAYLKRSVTIRRTNRATGKVTTGDAVIQSGPRGGVLLTTADGVEALSCSGLPESLSYPGVPEGLSAKPTLSVVTDSPVAATATVQLSYLAQGFDWSANYVARVADDGKTLDLFAWLTVANGGSQGFAGASTQAVAGGLHREQVRPLPKGPPPELRLQCWPMDITSTHPKWSIDRAPPQMEMLRGYSDIVVTASRRDRMMMAPPPPPPPPAPVPVMVAQQEDLGDLKLYRIPEPVTVAALSRKQVAMIDRKGVRFERIYTGVFNSTLDGQSVAMPSQPAELVLRTENSDAKGLGLPLPAGAVAVFEAAGGTPMLVGESGLKDRAIGEEVELGAGTSPDLRYVTTALPRGKRRAAFTVRVTNARATPETFELPLPFKVKSASMSLVERKGVKTWRVAVPANDVVVLNVTFDVPK
ncbi:MAG: hypothetical protein P0Y59_20890 [Candidatus Sphingomonas phytovorans]|nr:hypothetical protein [Sphingomonas sp.]WEJ99358.1 MAG: hypothetical protein P0Y59_20890 [Sphingomonas sp.]